jgi:hypothetical protein
MKKWIRDINCTLLVFLWVYAACSKLLNYTSFRHQLISVRVIGMFAGIAATVVPALEILAALLLTIKNTRISGLYISIFLLVTFTLFISGMLLSGKRLPCSCGGVIQGLSWSSHLLFNLFFIILNWITIVLEKKQFNHPVRMA